MRKLRGRFGRDDGYTLVELITVMAILGIVLAPLTHELCQRHGPAGEPDAARTGLRECQGGAAENAARHPLRKRGDIRRAECIRWLHVDADGVERPEPRGLVPRRHPGRCRLVRRSVVHGAVRRARRHDSTSIDSSGRIPTDCDGGVGSTFETSYLAAQPGAWPTNSAAVGSSGSGTPTSWVGNLWPTAVTCQSGYLPTLSVDFNVNVDPVNHPNEHYEMTDSITLRNAPRCH